MGINIRQFSGKFIQFTIIDDKNENTGDIFNKGPNMQKMKIFARVNGSKRRKNNQTKAIDDGQNIKTIKEFKCFEIKTKNVHND